MGFLFSRQCFRNFCESEKKKKERKKKLTNKHMTTIHPPMHVLTRTIGEQVDKFLGQGKKLDRLNCVENS